MASNITVDTLTKGSTTLNTDEIVDTNSNQICKAWVNFNGTGTVAIRDSHNVSSITDNGTGDYTVNFTNAMANGNYAVALSGTDIAYGTVPYVLYDTAMLTTSCRLQNRGNYSAVGLLDIDMFSFMCFGD